VGCGSGDEFAGRAGAAVSGVFVDLPGRLDGCALVEFAPNVGEEADVPLAAVVPLAADVPLAAVIRPAVDGVPPADESGLIALVHPAMAAAAAASAAPNTARRGIAIRIPPAYYSSDSRYCRPALNLDAAAIRTDGAGEAIRGPRSRWPRGYGPGWRCR